MCAIEAAIRLDAVQLGRTLDDLERIGNRYHGSAGEASCRDYLVERFETIGLERVRLEPFRYLAYEHESASCTVVAPARQQLECRAVQYSANAEAEGQAVYVGTGTPEDFARIDALGTDLSDKVVLAHSIAPFMVAPFLESRNIAALVNVGETPDGLVGNFTAALYPPPLEPPWEGRPVPYPAVTIEAAAGRALISTMTSGTRVTLSVSHRARYVEKDSANVVGEIAGSTEEQVIVGGHYDGQSEGTCIWDNGTGVASTIEIARVLAGEQPRRTIVVAAWAVEEVGLWGSTAYSVQHADEMQRVIGMANLDAVASRYPAKRTIWADEAMRDFAIETAELEGWSPEVVFDARQFNFSDNSPFTVAGVPACWIWEFPTSNPYYHSAGDVRDIVDADKVAVTAGVTGRLVQRLALGDVDLGRASSGERDRSA